MVNDDRPEPPADPTQAVRWSRQSNAGRIAARLESHRPSHAAGRRAERLGGPHRRCRIREPQHVRRPDPDTELHANRRRRRSLQPVPCDGTLFADARGSADRPEQPHGRLRVDRRVRGRIPGLLRDPAARLRAVTTHSSRQRVQHGRVRQVAPDARRPARSGRSARPLAERVGLRLLLRVPRRRCQPMGSVPGREPEDHRHRPAVLRRGQSVLLPRRDGRPHDRVAARRARAGCRQAVLRLLLDRLQSLAAPRREGVGRQVQGQVRPGLGPAARGDLCAAEGTRCRPGRRRTHRARRRRFRRGTTCRTR